MDKVKYNDYSEILSNDLNNTSEYLENAISYVLQDFFTSTPVVIGLKVVAQAAQNMTVCVQSGRTYQSGQQGILDSTSSAITITAANAQYNRIDRICAKYIDVEDTPEIRNVMVDVSTRSVNRQTINTRIHGTVSFQVVPGVASASPVPPTIPDGWVSLAQVTVRANASFISDTDIMDERPLVQALPGFMDKLNAHIQGTAVHMASQITAKTANGTKTLQDIADMATTKGVSTGRNTVLAGPVDSNGKPAALYSDLASGNIALKAGALIDFAAGFNDSGPIDYIEKIPADLQMALAAADSNTVPIAYTADLCNGGTAISNVGTAANAFDNSGGSSWLVGTGTTLKDTAYIGYNFGKNVAIRKIAITKSNTVGYTPTAIDLQYSTDGSVWMTCLSINLVDDGKSNQVVFNLPRVVNAQYWRLIARANTTIGWEVIEIEMMEVLQTYYLLADRAADGTNTLVATKQKPRQGAFDASNIYTDNLCVGGVAISSDQGASTDPNDIFNGTSNFGTQPGGSVKTDGSTFVGYNFGVARKIKRIYLKQHDLQGASPQLTVQYSDDGTSWSNIGVFTASGGVNILILPDYPGGKYIRIYPSAQVNGGSSWQWLLYDRITMHELSTDINHYDITTGISRHYDGSAWMQVSRVAVGEATIDSSGKITSVTVYDYGLINYLRASKIVADVINVNDIRVPAATQSDQPVQLGQFTQSFGSTGCCTLPNGLLLQWFPATVPGNNVISYFNLPTSYKNMYRAFGNFTLSTPSGVLGVDFSSKSQVAVTNSGTSTQGAVIYTIGN